MSHITINGQGNHHQPLRCFLHWTMAHSAMLCPPQGLGGRDRALAVDLVACMPILPQQDFRRIQYDTQTIEHVLQKTRTKQRTGKVTWHVDQQHSDHTPTALHPWTLSQ
jgi:hypothetical protein